MTQLAKRRQLFSTAQGYDSWNIYIDLLSSVSKEEQLLVFAYTLQETPLTYKNILGFMEVIRLFNSHPLVSIKFSEPLVDVKLVLTKDVKLKFKCTIAQFISNKELMIQLAQLQVDQVTLSNKSYCYQIWNSQGVEEDMSQCYQLFQIFLQLLDLFKNPTYKIEFKFDQMCPENRLLWFNQITHVACHDINVSFDNFVRVLINLKTFEHLKALKFQLKNPELVKVCLIYASQLINLEKIRFEFVDQSPVDKQILKLMQQHRLFKVEFKITYAKTTINTAAVDFYSGGIGECLTVDDTNSDFSLLPELDNLRIGIINSRSLKGFTLKNSSIDQLQLGAYQCSNLDLSGMTKLSSLVFKKEHVSVNTETFENLPGSITNLSISEAFINPEPPEKSLFLPKYLQTLSISVKDLTKFDFSKCLHLSNLYLKIPKGIVFESSRYWNHLPDTLSTLLITYGNRQKLQKSSKAKYISSSSSPYKYRSTPEKAFGIKIDKKYKTFNVSMVLYGGGAICINTDFIPLPELKNVPCWSKINIHDELKFHLLVNKAGTAEFPVVFCPKSLLHNVIVSNSNFNGRRFEVREIASDSDIVLLVNKKTYGKKNTFYKL